ncbi:MAG: molybdate ABC transporter substrate-binding protein [Planctomyces sp.]|nr:molybdate ABC transporter substrate-binding protein [Planctomyces sp.]
MNRTIAFFAGSVIVVAAIIGILTSSTRRGSVAQAQTPIEMFCAASNRAAVEVIRKKYEEETGRRVNVQYGPSQTLLSSLEISGSADLYLPADDTFIVQGTTKNLLSETIPIATMHAVIAVPRGNPRGIHSFSDLTQPGVKVVQANPETTAIGQLSKKILSESGHWDQLQAATIANRTTVTDAANDVIVGSADAAVVYDVIVSAYPDLEAVRIPELENAVSNVLVSVTTTTKRSADALHFARYLTASDRGLPEYKKAGFETVDGDQWADRPEISLYAGSMLKPAIEETLKQFSEREGVSVIRVYNGCGILVAQMKAGQKPDAYFACDSEFMQQVTDLFPDPVNVSRNELVILVQKGNPHSIRTLMDLGKGDLRVGIGHEKQCAMGWLTQNTLREGGVQNEVMKNVTMQAPTGDMLVNQLRTGALDAAVAYLSNAAGAQEELDAIRIQGLECAIAIQPFAVSESTPYPRLTQRLFDQLSSPQSQETFLAEGFQWGLNMPEAKTSVKNNVSN